MLANLKKHWQTASIIFALVLLAFNFYAWQAEAKDTQQKVSDFEETFAKISQIAERLEDPNVWLKNYLLNHGEDSASVEEWVSYARNAPMDSAGVPRNNVIFYESAIFPEIGVIKMYIVNNETILDTLWNYTKK